MNAPSDEVVAFESAQRMHCTEKFPSRSARARKSFPIGEGRFAECDKVHLVYGDEQMANTEEGSDKFVPLCRAAALS